ncbi:MAG: hypothetical protein CMI52_05100 [Parcubacteria group bacterium]|nr:hypothetical protein [Parcubacteria group bacterium]
MSVKKLVIIFSIVLMGAAPSFLFGEERLENEIKLSVPIEIHDEVLAYMLDNFVDERFVFEDFRLDGEYVVEQFIDSYYDSSKFDVLDDDNGIRYQRRFADGEMSSHIVQVKVAGEDTVAKEFKFEIDDGVFDDRSPALDDLIVDAVGFSDLMLELSYDENKLRPALELAQIRDRVLLGVDDEPRVTLTLDSVYSKKWWIDRQFVELELELNEVYYTAADEVERARLVRLIESIEDEITSEFEEIVPNQRPKYSQMYEKLNVFPLSWFWRPFRWLGLM